MKAKHQLFLFLLGVLALSHMPLESQIGTRFPSERKVVQDPVTGVDLIFLTSAPAGDHKIYQTHNQWTSDGKWLIFRSRRVRGEAMAVNELTGDMVQATEGGYRGTLLVARKSMKLYYMKGLSWNPDKNDPKIVEVDLERLFTDSEAGTLKDESAYQRVCGSIPPEMGPGGDMALDAGEEWIWFRVGTEEAEKHLPEGTELEPDFGPRNMGAGPGGIAGINILTGEIKHVISVPFQVGHIQSNPWVPGQIVFCWETGGKASQRTWIVHGDGTGLRPLYPEAPYEWVTHETFIGPDEVAFAIMGHRKIRDIGGGETQEPEGLDQPDPGQEGEVDRQTNPGQEPEWGNTGTREKPTGLGVVNTTTREMMIEGQIPYGSGFWHVTGSPDGRFLAGDNFAREIYLIDRHSHEMKLISAGHKRTASDHPHPTFSPDGTRIVIQSAMLSEDDRSMNICVIPVPEEWLTRENGVQWPGGAKAAICLTYDDALDSQLDIAIPDLNKYGFRGTFYLQGDNLRPERIAHWRLAAMQGHELGNHTAHHPCSGSLDFITEEYAAENYSVDRIMRELKVVNALLNAIDGKEERTYAYTCGQTEFGGVSIIDTLKQSGLFLAARGVGNNMVEDPFAEDPFNFPSVILEGATGREHIDMLETTRDAGGILVFTFHGVGGDYLQVSREAHEELLSHLDQNRETYWVAPFNEVMKYVKAFMSSTSSE